LIEDSRRIVEHGQNKAEPAPAAPTVIAAPVMALPPPDLNISRRAVFREELKLERHRRNLWWGLTTLGATSGVAGWILIGFAIGALSERSAGYDPTTYSAVMFISG